MKGMQKISRGKGFGGALRYAFERREGDEAGLYVGGNMNGHDPESLTREFAVVHRLRPDIEKPVWHNALRLPEGEKLSAEQWQKLADDYMARMGFSELHQRVYVLHDDPEGQHIHIVASRVALDGSVYLGQNENFISTRHIQKIEREYGLTITKGPTYEQQSGKVVMPDERGFKKNELERAVRTGEEPARQKLRRVVDAAMEGKPTAVEFAERLEAAGVSVRANIASTGRMNGFSFEMDGVAFKGSQLGAAYTWARLQQSGVSYEQARDSEGLKHYRATGEDRGEREGVTADRERTGGGLEPAGTGEVTRSGIERDSGGAGTAGGVERERNEGSFSLRQGDGSAEGITRTDVSRAAEPGQQGVSAEGESVRAFDAFGDGSRRNAPAVHEITDPDRSQFAERGREPADSGHEDRATLETGDRLDIRDRADRGGSRGDWAYRFKLASAQKRDSAMGRLRQGDLSVGHGERAVVSGVDKRAAREVDPTDYLQRLGYSVRREGRHLSVRAGGDEVYRITQKEGHFVWCDRYGNVGGDNIALVQDVEPGIKFSEAVFKLSGGPTVAPQPQRVGVVRNPPVMPLETPQSVTQGRQYLYGRGIDLEVAERAEKAGMLRYASGGVLFVGRDSANTPRNVTRRATGNDQAQKRDLRGSDKQYPPILPGNPRSVWIVEGGTDALALHTLAERKGTEPPTVIVSGGSNVRGFLENPDVQKLLKAADRVTIAGENEKDLETQRKADMGHQKQADRVAEITGKSPSRWTPATEQGKDLADVNHRESEKIKQERLKEINQSIRMDKQRQQEQIRERSRNRGLER